MNLKVQPASDQSGDYVLVLHAETSVEPTHKNIDVGSVFYDRIGVKHLLYRLAARIFVQGPLGQFLRLRVSQSSDGSGDFVLLGKLSNGLDPV